MWVAPSVVFDKRNIEIVRRHVTILVMKIISLIFCSLLFVSCSDKATEPTEDLTPRLVLSANRTSGQSPLTVTYTGKFLGKIDTIKMLVPDSFLFPGTGRTIISYALPDTTQPAKQTYTADYTYSAGTYKAVMLLQSKHKNFYSDTITITVN